jgi:hypothetical protein
MALRVFIFFAIYFVVLISLMRWFPLDQPPARGGAAIDAVGGTWFFSLVALGILTLFVVDATILCQYFVRRLSGWPSDWRGLRQQRDVAAGGLHDDLRANWLDMRLIARRTRIVQRFILYPFVVVILLILARNPYFDRWTWPLSMTLFVVVNLLIVMLCAVTLRREAEKARQKILARLRTQRLVASGTEDPGYSRESVEAIIAEVSALREGAFAPLSQHPIIGAIVLPFGGVSVAILLEYLATM